MAGVKLAGSPLRLPCVEKAILIFRTGGLLRSAGAFFLKKRGLPFQAVLFSSFVKYFYFAALAALIASISSGVTLNRSPQMP